MFLIAYLTGMDVKDLASMNNMKEPYSLSVGQTLKISNCSTKTVTTTVPVKTTAPAAPAAPAEPEVTYTPGANGTQIGSDGTVARIDALEGSVPSAINPPTGCRFHDRCEFATDLCAQKNPELREVCPGHRAACHFVEKINALKGS